jgi:hypothetical protein
MEIDNEKSPLKTMWPLLDLLLNGRLKKLSVDVLPPSLSELR